MEGVQMTAIPPGDPDKATTFADLVDPKNLEAYQAMGGLEGLSKALNTDPATGLTSEDAITSSRTQFGSNMLPELHFKTFWQLVWEALHDRTLIMLLIAACISLAVGMSTEGVELGWADGFAVLVAVAVVVLITSVNDYQKEQQFRKLNEKKSDHPVTVVRNGQKKKISVLSLVVGDVVLLATGDVVPADGVLIDGVALQTDESSATGEADTIRKRQDKDPFFLSGTQIVEGSGSMVAIAVGTFSYNGKLMVALRAPTVDTPLQTKLGYLANIIGNFGIIAAIFIFMVQIIKYFAIEGDDVDASDAIREVVDFLVISITIVVVAVPEGLPLAVTISLAYSMKHMMKDNNLVRHLDACETMGGATTVCSDKTGTLTQNKMTVVEGWLFGNEFSSKTPLEKDSVNPDVLERFFENVSVNSTAYEGTLEDGSKEFIGSRTECALLKYIQGLGGDFEKIREEVDIVEQFPFSSKRKRMSTAVYASKGDHSANATRQFHTKGASEVVLRMCSDYVLPDGTTQTLDEATRSSLEKRINDMATDALRTLTLAYRTTTKSHDLTDDESPGLVFFGVVGIRDPLREEVPAAVEACRRAGVIVRMVTGDNVVTARNIAKACGIWKDESDVVIEGVKFRKLTDRQRLELVPKLRVMARSSPNDKHLLVSTLQELGDIVAVTGDGVNDGPALKKGDVGFSMGITGTEVAKEASDIVLLDDNFASIVQAIKWGRNVFDNIRKFLQFQLTVNFTAILVVFIGIVADPDGRAESAPLKSVQLLWVNLIMDSLAALSLATEPANTKLLEYQPYSRKEPLMTPYMRNRTVYQIVLQTTTFIVILFAGESWFNSEKPAVGSPDFDPDHDKGQFSDVHYTIIFTSFVITQMFNEFNARKIRRKLNVFGGLEKHPLFVVIWILSFIVQVLMTEFGGRDFAHTTGLTGAQWGGCILVGILPLVWTFLFNLLPASITEARYRLMHPFDDPVVTTEAEVERMASIPLAGVTRDADGSFVVDVDTALDSLESQPEAPVNPAARWKTATSSVISQINVVEAFRRKHR